MSENRLDSQSFIAEDGAQVTRSQTLRWSIFCRVIDNFGDIGVCWRLSRALAARGHRVRLWVDDASALQWMQPSGCEGVQVMDWQPLQPMLHDDWQSDVIVEAFGCEIDSAWVAQQFAIENRANYVINTAADGIFGTKKPIWINLEYLSAESYVERCHGLRSPVMQGAAKGLEKWFFYPGFTAGTGGLIQDSVAWQEPSPLPSPQGRGSLHFPLSLGERVGVRASGDSLGEMAGVRESPPALQISLFCYESPALPQFISQLHGSSTPTELLVTAGRATHAVKSHLNGKKPLSPRYSLDSLLLISYQPDLTQDGYDELLASCAFNIVRGEDSLVRALLAGNAFAWHIYPQSDEAHRPKLDAFLDWLQAPPDLRRFMRVFNGLEQGDLPPIQLSEWTACAQAARQKILAQTDLVTQLIDFIQEKRKLPHA